MSRWSAHARDRLRHEVGQRGRERADAQPPARLARDAAELLAREREALGDGVGVLEQDLAGAREPQPAGLAVDQPDADLALEGGDLVGHRGLRERERARCARERPLVRHRTERQHPPRIHSPILSACPNDHLKL
jgi:hypothetical protein